MARKLDKDPIWRSSSSRKDVLVRPSNPFYFKCHTIYSRQVLWGPWQVSGRIIIIANNEIGALTIAGPYFNYFT